MRNHKAVSALAGLLVASGLALSPIAAASPSSTVDATGGSGTQVDSDGTQGEFVPAVQGTTDDDGDQDAYTLKLAEVATPQFKATPN